MDKRLYIQTMIVKIFNQLLKSINKNIHYRLFLLVNDYNEPYACEHNQYYTKINLFKMIVANFNELIHNI